MKRRFKININHNSEFELDLAPLLAVMVKLVPVLLISSAFVQMMIIETELPQIVKEAISQQADKPKTKITFFLSSNTGVKISVQSDNGEKVQQINMNKNQFDLEKIYAAAVEIKKSHPEIFKVDFSPEADVSYKDIIKIIDEVRKSKSADLQFPIKELNSEKMTSTNYLFPEVSFNNIFEG